MEWDSEYDIDEYNEYLQDVEYWYYLENQRQHGIKKIRRRVVSLTYLRRLVQARRARAVASRRMIRFRRH